MNMESRECLVILTHELDLNDKTRNLASFKGKMVLQGKIAGLGISYLNNPCRSCVKTWLVAI